MLPRALQAARAAARRPLVAVVLVTVALVTVALVACSRTGGVDRVASSLYGEIRFAGDVLVVPGLRWEPRAAATATATAEDDGGGDAAGWQIVNQASLVVVVAADATPGPLVVRLATPDAADRFAFRAAWDETPLPGSAVTSPAPGRHQVTVPAAALTPGLHVLALQRDRWIREPTVVAELAYDHGGDHRDLAAGDAARLHRVADFLLRGVVGDDDAARRGGVLFVGAREETLALPATAGSLRLEPENLSPAPATWRLGIGDRELELELAAGERGVLSLPLPADGDDRGDDVAVRLAVDGEDDGLFLWGMPLVDGEAADDELPPVVVITLDTTRRDAVYPWNGDRELTPRLAALADGATTFDHAYSTAPWTLPSHASIMTGLYPSRHRAGVVRDQIDTAAPTLARLLRDAGYLTAGYSAGYLTSYRFGLGLGFAQYRDPDGFETKGDRVVAHVAETVDAYADWPLFLFVNLFDPHALYVAPERFAERLGVPERAAALAGQPLWKRMAKGDGGVWKSVIEGEAEATPEGLAWLRAAYLAEVAFADHLVGEVVDLLERHDLFERSLFIVTADHGELLGEGGYYSHSARLDPELVEIPLLVKWPHQREPARVTTPVSLVDLYPTVLAAAGVEVPGEVDGRLLTPEGPQGPPRPYLFFEEHEHRVHPLEGRMKIASHLYGVQKPSFRQVAWEAGDDCARRRDDGWERVPCPDEGAVVLRQIEAVLGPRAAGRPADAGVVSEDMRKSLEALGYL